MRKIFVDQSVKDVAEDYKAIIMSMDKRGAITPLSLLKDLRDNLSRKKITSKSKVMKYLDLLIINYNHLLNADPDQIKLFINDFNSILLPNEISKITIGSRKPKYIWDEIFKATRYDYVRQIVYPQISTKIGIRACVYCNAAIALSHERVFIDFKKRKTDIVTRFELDHFYPKSEYPFLSVGFFNLYPVCGSCNKLKSDKPALFELYTSDKSDLDVFYFEIERTSLARFLVDFDHNELNIRLDSSSKAVKENHQNLFGVEGLYNTQKDICSEIIIRALAYPKKYRAVLISKYPKLRLNPELVDRVIAGNYLKPEDTHKRPMVKLHSDIWEQLNGKRGL